MNEMVLYYTPAKSAQAAKLKGVLVRMGIRIRNITPEQIHQQIGTLAGISGYGESSLSAESADSSVADISRTCTSLIPEEVLVLHQFTEQRLDTLLFQLRKAGVRIALKAIVTESNCDWTFLALYEELKREHAAMAARTMASAPRPSDAKEGS